MGFEDKDEPYGKDERLVLDGIEGKLSSINNTLMFDSTILLPDKSRNLNVYPVWECFGYVIESVNFFDLTPYTGDFVYKSVGRRLISQSIFRDIRQVTDDSEIDNWGFINFPSVSSDRLYGTSFI